MKIRILSLGGIWFFLLVLTACQQDKSSEEQAPALTQKVNQFIWTYVDDAYLWTNQIPHHIDYRYENDPKAYFKKLLYTPDDRWSYVTDEADKMMDSYKGVETSYGYSVQGFYISGQPDTFAVVQYTYKNSPAEEAGLQRGDIIWKINGAPVSSKNLNTLYHSPQITLTLGTYDANSQQVEGSDRQIGMTARKMYEDPIQTYRIFSKNNLKIGYLCYTGYIPDSQEALKQVFAGFKSAGVSEIILDLRYNPGGAASTACFLSSILAPASVLNGRTLYLQHFWNERYNDYWAQNGADEQLYTYFDPSVQSVNMNLHKLYVLTGNNTASASEATMVGLKPYLELIQIGATTHGKYCGALLIQPQTKVNGEWEIDKNIGNWAMSLIVYKFANADGETDFKNGFTPTFAVKDILLGSVYPLGDENEPMLAKALELITGQPSPATSTARTLPENLRSLPDPRQKIRQGRMWQLPSTKPER